MKESSTYQAILAEGRMEGIAAGRIEARVEGRVEGAQRMLRRFVARKLEVTNLRIAATIDSIHDIDLLEKLADRLVDAPTWEELLAMA